MATQTLRRALVACVILALAVGCALLAVLWRGAVADGDERAAALEKGRAEVQRQLDRAVRTIREGEAAWNVWNYAGEDRAALLSVCDFPLSICRSNEQSEVTLAIPDAVVSVDGDYAVGSADRALLELFGITPGETSTNAFADVKGLKLSSANPNPVVLDDNSDIWDFECPLHPLGFNSVSVVTEHDPGAKVCTADRISGLRYCASDEEAFKFAKTLLGHLAAATGARILPLGEITEHSGKWAVDTRRVFMLVMLDNIVMPDGSPRHFVSLSIADKDSEHRGLAIR